MSANEMVYGGLLDNLLKNFLDRVKVDLRKVDKNKLKHGIQDFADALKPAISAPFDLDDKALDMLAEFLLGWVENALSRPPLIVGSGKSENVVEGVEPLIAALIALAGPMFMELIAILKKRNII